ncbi:MAG: GspE/PulE family protein [Phycisphaerales bacterium]
MIDAASARFAEVIPRDFARRHLVVDDGVDGDAQLLAIAATTSALAVRNVATRLARPVRTRVDDAERVARRIDELYERALRDGPASAAPARTVERGDDESADPRELARLLSEADRDLLNLRGKGRVVLLVDALLFDALGRGASDVHVQPLADRTVVRYRVDGVLHEVRELSPALAGAVTSRIKVMGRMDIAERRAPQDGRATVAIGGRAIDLRISTVPTSHGERAVVRLLDHSGERLGRLTEFASLGMPERVAEPFLARATRANGIILVTGPTGSGKTTTLYATIRRVGTDRLNAMTIEDPIEYELSSAGLRVSQSQVNPRKGVTFATGLRHILRQDPDVVMVGEIRDAETARTAIQASLTGHLVLSTLHTNDAPSAVTRLVDLGVEPYLVSASLSAVLAQRLVRTVHRACDAAGCEECLGTGLKGRTGVFELLVVTEAMRALVTKGADAGELRAQARRDGMATLLEEGERLVGERRTTREEVERVLLGAV